MLRKLSKYVHPYGPVVLLGVICAASEAVFELLIPMVMSDIVDVGIPSGDTSFILKKGGIMVCMALISLAFGVGSAVCSSVAGQGFGANLRAAEYEQLQRFAFSNIERFSTASLVTRLTNDCTNLQMALMMGMRLLVRAPVMMIAALILSMRISLRLSSVFLVSLPLLAFFVGLIIYRASPLFRQLQEQTDALNLVVQEDLSAIRVVKSFVREGAEEEKFAARSDAMKNTALRAFGMVVINMPVMMLIIYGTLIAVMWFGGHLVYSGALDPGGLMAYFTYITQIMVSAMMVSMIFMMLTRSIASGRRILEVLGETPAIRDDGADPALEVADGSITFDHVTFRYHASSEDAVLRDISLSIPAGATVGILGGTGSGKSSLVSLIPRLYEAQEGTVLVGGRPVQDYPLHTLREAVSVVLQKNTLFSGSVRENLRWGDPDASDEKIMAACRAACADEFVMAFPDGLDHDLGQGGANVSGGQKQRLCIARALLKSPKVLILDDSTSAVDTATDAKIRAALKDIRGMTKLIIAQRVTSVMEADLILVMEDGAIADSGTHAELMVSCPLYRSLYESQQKGVSIDG